MSTFIKEAWLTDFNKFKLHLYRLIELYNIIAKKALFNLILRYKRIDEYCDY